MENLKYFLMLYHAPRSGSTLLTAILNANPNCIISNQQFILNSIEKNIFDIIKNGSQPGYFKPTTQIPHVPKKEITVIGDKTGHRHLTLLEKNPVLLGKLKQKIKVPIKSILVVRNPYDVISTWGILNHQNKIKNNKPSTIENELNIVIEKYRKLNETTAKLKRSEDIFTVNHEYIITNTHNTLEKICEFLEISFDPKWRDFVRDSIWKKPRITRNKTKWGQSQKKLVSDMISRYEWLKGYDFGSCGGCAKKRKN